MGPSQGSIGLLEKVDAGFQDEFKGLTVRYTFRLDTIKLNPWADTEFWIMSKTKTICVVTKDQETRNGWVEAIEKAKQEFEGALARRDKRAESFSIGDGGRNPEKGLKGLAELLGSEKPVLYPKGLAEVCQVDSCQREFGFLRWRHHCHACGAVVCRYCSKYEMPLKYQNFEEHKVCEVCFHAR